MVTWLLAHGLDPNVRNASKKTPLDSARWRAQGWDLSIPYQRQRAAEADVCIRLLYRYGGKPSEPQK